MSWNRKIRESHIFLVIGVKEYFEDAICLCQTELAKELKNPFGILLKKGISLPPGFLDDIEKYELETWETLEELRSATERILNSLIPHLLKERG